MRTCRLLVCRFVAGERVVELIKLFVEKTEVGPRGGVRRL